MAKSSSSRKLLVSNNLNHNYFYINNIIGTIINILIVYYLINLEHKYCDCIRDWRHDYLKYSTMFFIFINLLVLSGFKIDITNVSGIIIILNIITIYSFYTYIRDLDNTKCECAVVKQEKLHKFLNVWRYFIVIIPIVVLCISIFIFIHIMNKK